MEYGRMVDEKDGGVYPSPHHQHALALIWEVRRRKKP